MTKEEAQIIIDGIDPETVIDNNWLGYLLEEPNLLKLRALQIITGINWQEFVEKHEGDYISDFQTKPAEIYVGRIMKFNGEYHLIISQDDKDFLYGNNQLISIKSGIHYLV